MEQQQDYILFFRQEALQRGTLAEIAERAAALPSSLAAEETRIYDLHSGGRIELDLRGSLEQIIARLGEHPLVPEEQKASLAPRGPGRPKLGVVGGEVTLLPRHWEWLKGQRGGASVTLRRLIDEARQQPRSEREMRREQLSALHRLLWDLAGDLPHFEDATRALDRQDGAGFAKATESWPEDIRTLARERAKGLLQAGESSSLP